MNIVRRSFALFLVGLAVTALISACSLRYDFTECETSADCQQLESANEFFICQSNECVPVSIECRTDDDCAGASTCEQSACVEPVEDAGMDMPVSDMGADMPVVPDMPEDDIGPEDVGGDDADMGMACTIHDECADTELCIEGRCVQAITDQCPRMVRPSGAQKTVVIGSIFPLEAPFENIGPPLSQAIELAVKDFNREGGLIAGQQVVWVSCNDNGSSAQAQQVARHLVDNLDVPAIIGPLFSTPFTDVINNVTRPAGVFTITPTATAPSLTTLDDNDLGWRTIPSDVIQGNAIVSRVFELVDAGAVSSMTLFVKDDAYGNGLFNQISTPLTQKLTNQGFNTVKYPADPSVLQAEASNLISTALMQNASADLILAVGTTEAISLVSGYINALKNQGVASADLPRVLFSHGAVADMTALVQTHNDLATKTEGIAPNIFHPVNFDIYKTRFDAEFPGEPPLSTSPLAYDATAVTLLSMMTIPESEEITGAKIADGMSMLVEKMDANVVTYATTSWIGDARQSLRNGEAIDFIGISGDLDFDVTTGDLRSDYLGFVNIPSEMVSGQFQLQPFRIYALAPTGSLGLWFDLCDSTQTAMCSATHVCLPPEPMLPENALCFRLCDPNAMPTDCRTGLQCQPISAMASACLPPPT